MIDGPFRERLPAYCNGLIQLYQRLGLSPNQISLAAFLLACLAAVFTAAGLTWLALSLWWLGRLLDGTDGIYARATGQSSKFGAFLDILCDMASYSVMILGFMHLHPGLAYLWLTIMALYVLCITGAISLGAIEAELSIETSDNRGVRLAVGLAEGGETGLAYSLFLLLPGFIEALVWLWICVLGTTIIARAILAHRILQPFDKES